MNILVLLLSVIIPFPLCLFRMKKYSISLAKMLLIYVVFSIVGAIGACVGSAVDGGTILGKRLYGLMIFDTGALIMVSLALRMNLSDLGDFVAVPIMATCFASKIDCIVKDCCHGIILYQLEMQQPVRFPSAFTEMSIWGIMTVLLLIMERQGQAKGLLWPIGLIWFGTARFIADFLRGSPFENEILLLGMTGGQFWSLVTFIIGVFYLYFSIRNKLGRNPSVKEVLRVVFGVHKYIKKDEFC